MDGYLSLRKKLLKIKKRKENNYEKRQKIFKTDFISTRVSPHCISVYGHRLFVDNQERRRSPNPVPRGAEENVTNLSMTSAVGSDVVAPVRGNKSGGSYSAYKAEFDTDSVDGFKDAAYNYGAHFYGDLPANTPNNSTTFDAYVSYGTDGLAHIYCEIYDKDIVVNDDLWNYKNWHCDSMDIYV